MRTTGTVKWFNDSKGFGFITPEEFGHPGRGFQDPQRG
jgi:cold shock CspA family protein